eukprot:TRINITY_DN43005_c0_g1_i1.p1 TRINITY_DN43005_c0_g1~~TRINITY_DN43005_c0_g1_i1.p1  ORF type:complete len:234 (+),score=29.59 TRINITY_DN43005_c0_g1_i1:76-777(+)
MDYVAAIKDLQRSDAVAKEQWWAYADSQGGGIRDPAKHDTGFLQTFVNNYNAGMRFEVTEPMEKTSYGGGGQGATLVELFKEGQRKSGPWKMAWALYCDMNGAGKHDPAKHDPSFLRGFMDFLGQRATMVLQGGMGMGVGMGVGMMPGMGMGMGMAMGGPPAKRARTDSSMYHASGSSTKDDLVSKIKSFQRSGESQKQQWWDYADGSLGGVRDPAKHDVATLRQFVSSYNVA